MNVPVCPYPRGRQLGTCPRLSLFVLNSRISDGNGHDGYLISRQDCPRDLEGDPRNVRQRRCWSRRKTHRCNPKWGGRRRAYPCHGDSHVYVGGDLNAGQAPRVLRSGDATPPNLDNKRPRRRVRLVDLRPGRRRGDAMTSGPADTMLGPTNPRRGNARKIEDRLFAFGSSERPSRGRMAAPALYSNLCIKIFYGGLGAGECEG
jgi:hypothetical protein